MIVSALLELRVAMAHAWVDRGANGNLPAECCLLCGLSAKDKVHSPKLIAAQRTLGDSVIAKLVDGEMRMK